MKSGTVVIRVLVGVLAASLLTGCWSEKTCGDGQYPVQHVDGKGAICIGVNDKIPDGYQTFAPGSTPTGRELS